MLTHSSNICKGDYIQINGNVCIVKERSVCGRGKHGESFYKFVGKDVLTHEDRALLAKYHVTRFTPRHELCIVNHVNTYVNVTRSDGSTVDLPIPEGELGTTISALCVTEPDYKVCVARVGNVEIITKAD